ncbi:F-box protein [Actinidia chinensis var. chinensis]|uniref:F-box protein n=1 Tax=Actinidia chinensis var. chinensis TaxID=1590841 RepID=A0A2R6PLW2_ACTCC|nr:F-box protein [Actinidia chinensis var. chinensis]
MKMLSRVTTSQKSEFSGDPALENTLSADKIASNDDLLSEILKRLPVRSLLCFKSVSKHFDTLISSPHFSRLRNPDPYSVSGLLLHPSMANFLVRNAHTEGLNFGLEFVPLTIGKKETDHDFTDFSGLLGTIVVSSCHGLFCCLAYTAVERKGGYHVFNPTTKHFTTLPEPHLDRVEGLSLAYDPKKSPHYNVVSVWSTISVLSAERHYQIEIYSSETGSWRGSGEAFTTNAPNTIFRGGVYWNGAINWLNNNGDSLYFSINQERVGTMPMVPVPEGKQWYDRQIMYYGESRDHLHIVEIYSPTTQFNVYEMQRDYSGWVVKYTVDLASVGAIIPEILQIPENWYCSYNIVSLVRGKRDEESYLVLHVAGKFICYNLVQKTFKTIFDGSKQSDGGGVAETPLRYYWFNTYQYMESFSSV